MKLINLGDYIEQNSLNNSDGKFGKKDVMGMTVDKRIIPTKADVKDKELPKFIVVNEKDFIYNPRTHGKRIGLGFNDLNKRFIISWNNIAFHIKEDKINELDPYYLYMFFNRDEWDRMACFDSWGSSTEVFSWESLCEMKMYLPDITVQKKFVNLYKRLRENLQYQMCNNDDLKLICDSYIEDLKNKIGCKKLGDYIARRDERNRDNKNKNVYGLSTQKKFRKPQKTVKTDDLSSYKIVHNGDVAFVPTTDTWKVLAFSINDMNKDIVVSPIYEVFEIKNKSELIPEYLAIWLKREEFDRYARYNSWGSARENFTYDDMCEVLIPVPEKSVQEKIVAIYNSYITRNQISEKLESILKDIFPLLIKGSLMEAENE